MRKKKRGVFTARGWLAIGLILCAIAGACATADDVTPSTPPEWIGEVPPDGVLWGTGSARLQIESLALQAASTQARREIAEQLNVQAQTMVTEYVSEGETLIRETITREITSANLSGAVINAREQTADGTWWVRVSLPKADAMKVISAAVDRTAASSSDIEVQEALKMLNVQLEKDQELR
jgi:hypothetical protein